MKDVLTFVRGAVADRVTALPVLKHFSITGSHIQGTNGRIAIEAPCDELHGIEALVPADRFLSAVDACESEPKLRLTDTGRLSISRGKFQCHLPTQPLDTFPHSTPSGGKLQRSKSPLLPALRALRPFIGEDSTRHWCLTVHADGEHAYATNSAMIARIPATAKFQLPVFAIDELLRIGEEPSHTTQDEVSVTFFYKSDDPDNRRWLRTQLINDEWPTATAQDLLSWKKKLPALDASLIPAIESILPFCHDPKLPVIHFTDRGVSTAPGETQAEVAGNGWPPLAFDARNLLPMLRASVRFAIDPDTSRGLFEGPDGFRGVMAGQRVQIPSTGTPGRAPGDAKP